MRELGRLALQLKKDHAIACLCDAIDPSQFQKVVSSVRKVAGFDHESNTFATPSLALKLGHTLKKCAASVVAEALQTSARDKEDKANAFIRLCEMEWSNEVSSAALNTLHSKKMNRMTIMPLTQDVTALHSYLNKSSEGAVAVLQSGTADAESKSRAWLSLAQVLLAQEKTPGLSNRRGNPARPLRHTPHRFVSTPLDVGVIASSLNLLTTRLSASHTAQTMHAPAYTKPAHPPHDNSD